MPRNGLDAITVTKNGLLFRILECAYLIQTGGYQEYPTTEYTIRDEYHHRRSGDKTTRQRHHEYEITYDIQKWKT